MSVRVNRVLILLAVVAGIGTLPWSAEYLQLFSMALLAGVTLISFYGSLVVGAIAVVCILTGVTWRWLSEPERKSKVTKVGPF
jgi:hypothetical protein